MTIQDINLSDLKNSFRKKRELNFFYLKLNHLIRVDQEEMIDRYLNTDTFQNDLDQIKFYEDTNAFLRYFSLLEIASLAGVIPENLSDDIMEEGGFILENRFIKEYYEKTIPKILPQMFLVRVKTKFGLSETENKKVILFFIRFIELFQSIENDRGINDFISLFMPEGDSSEIVMLIEELRDPSKIAESFQKKEKTQLNIQAYFNFVNYLFELENMLSEMDDFPVLQSAFWHFHSDWFMGMKPYILPFLQDIEENLIATESNYHKIHRTDQSKTELEDFYYSSERPEINFSVLNSSISKLFEGHYKEYLEKRINEEIFEPH